MAILQALLTLISKSAGKVLNAIFGWAVRALFGQTTSREQTFLSAVVGAAVAWPLLLLGVAAPKMAALLIAFVPIPHWVPSWTVRVVWLSLAVIVPIGVGIALAAKAPAHAPPESIIKRILRGIPVTIGMAVAFILMFVSVPVMRFVALVRGLKSADIPLITDVKAYHQVADRITDVLRGHGFALRAAEPGWWVAAPTRILNFFGGDAFRAYVPTHLEHFVAPNLEVAIYPSGILLRGRRQSLAWAHGLIAETVVQTDGLQTTDQKAQAIERQVRSLWKAYGQAPEAHAGSTLLLQRVREMTKELGSLDVEFDDWQILYRQLLQAERAVRGNPQLLDDEVADAKGAGKMDEDEKVSRPATANLVRKDAGNQEDQLSTVEIVREVGSRAEHLIRAQVALAKAELLADLRAEGKAVKSLGVAAVSGLVALNLFLVTGALALAMLMPAWLAGLIVSAVVLVVAGVFGLFAWRGRVRRLMAHTRETMERNVQWTKEHVV